MQRATAMNGNNDPWLTWISHAFAGASIATLFGMLPVFFGLIASVLACLWYAVQLHENPTVRAFFQRRRERKAAKLKAKIDALMGKNKIPPLS
jgi:hypothetical protein